MKKLISLVLVLSMVMVLASAAQAASNTVSVNFLKFVNTASTYRPYTQSGQNKLTFLANAGLYASSSATEPVASNITQEFKVTALNSGGLYATFGTKNRWSNVSISISGLSASTYYTCQFGNTQERYYIKGTVQITHNNDPV